MNKKSYAKLIIGAIYSDPQWLLKAKSAMQRQKWEIQHQSQVFPFDQTDYYSTEMGEGLKRCFLSIRGLQSLELSADWKLKTTEIEQQLSNKEKEELILTLDILICPELYCFLGKKALTKYICVMVFGRILFC